MLLSLTAFALTAVGIVIQVRLFQGPPAAAVFILVFAAVVVDLSGVGAFVAICVPSNPIGWMMSAAGLAAALSFYGGGTAPTSAEIWIARR